MKSKNSKKKSQTEKQAVKVNNDKTNTAINEPEKFDAIAEPEKENNSEKDKGQINFDDLIF